MANLLLLALAAPGVVTVVVLAIGMVRGFAWYWAQAAAEELWPHYERAQDEARQARAHDDAAALRSAGDAAATLLARDAFLLREEFSRGVLTALADFLTIVRAAPGLAVAALIGAGKIAMTAFRFVTCGGRGLSVASLTLAAGVIEGALVEPALYQVTPEPIRLALLIAGLVLLELIAMAERRHRLEWST